MIKREKKSYTKEFRERVILDYLDGNESVSKVASRYQVNRDTVASWVYRRESESDSGESIKFVPSDTDFMQGKKITSPELMEIRIQELERQLELEQMRSQCLDKMIEIAERELQIDIRKKSGAKQSLRLDRHIRRTD
jgi:transposase-like protein